MGEKKMKSGHFLIAHTIINTALLSSCAIYISLTRDLSVESEDALVLPQVLAVIPSQKCFTHRKRSTLQSLGSYQNCFSSGFWTRCLWVLDPGSLWQLHLENSLFLGLMTENMYRI